ncbi:hypothetical protein Dfri01_59480 [Dyadobacter frigoris]|uniref:M23 family metallopeptidase n=1 Tax=Dyadobacter frigoris TaxID=2576211 RepID=UPI0024A15B9F|nr:M23 family metallopeptidase [Dyadobacter frigoris]GLU56487.1 hypothetical protein Dfri01_59480 [Dyadobacter frigoris]
MNNLYIFLTILFCLALRESCKSQVNSNVNHLEAEEYNFEIDSTDYRSAVIDILRDELNMKEILDSYMYLGIVDSTYLNTIPSINPLQLSEHPFITSLYGMRFHPIKKAYISHQGIDISCKRGFQFIYATADGVVSKSGYNGGLGLSVTIKHPSGFETVYGHLSGIYIRVNSKVQIGSVIGVMGETGLAKGIHLHYTIKRGGIPINPLPYLTLYQDFKQKRDALKASLVHLESK